MSPPPPRALAPRHTRINDSALCDDDTVRQELWFMQSTAIEVALKTRSPHTQTQSAVVGLWSWLRSFHNLRPAWKLEPLLDVLYSGRGQRLIRLSVCKSTIHRQRLVRQRGKGISKATQGQVCSLRIPMTLRISRKAKPRRAKLQTLSLPSYLKSWLRADTSGLRDRCLQALAVDFSPSWPNLDLIVVHTPEYAVSRAVQKRPGFTLLQNHLSDPFRVLCPSR